MNRHLQAEAEAFGGRLREVRQERGVTQDALAAKAAMTKAYISDMERGLKVPSLTTILRLAIALDYRVVDLIGVFDETDLASIVPK